MVSPKRPPAIMIMAIVALMDMTVGMEATVGMVATMAIGSIERADLAAPTLL